MAARVNDPETKHQDDVEIGIRNRIGADRTDDHDQGGDDDKLNRGDHFRRVQYPVPLSRMNDGRPAETTDGAHACEASRSLRV